MSDNEQLMKTMRQEFIPRESLEIKFHHINGTLNKMNLAIETLPRDLIRELDARVESRIAKLEDRQIKSDERLNRIETVYARILGGLIVLEVLFEIFKDSVFKK